MSDVVLPHSDEAEVEVLGSMMRSGQARDIASELDPDDFYRTAHRLLFETILGLWKRGVTPDSPAVLERLVADGRLDEVGGAAAVSEVGSFGTPANVGHYVAVIADCARRRRIHGAALELGRSVCDRADDLDELVDRTVQAMLDGGRGDGIVTVDDIYSDVLELVAGEHDSRRLGVDSGWARLDSFYRVVPGMVTVVTGIPGHGKSQWVDCLAHQLGHRHDWKFAYFSPEQGPPDDHAFRLLWTRLGNDPRYVARNGGQDAIADAVDWIGERVTWIDDLEDTRLASILARARAIKARAGLNGLIIDPWNKLDLPRPAGLREDLIIREALRQIVMWARRNDVHVWVVAHPTKMHAEPGSESRFVVPTAYDVSGGAEFFNQADAVVCIWRDQANERDDDRKTEIRIQKVKRAGPSGWGRIGGTSLWFDPPAMRYQPNQPLRAPSSTPV